MATTPDLRTLVPSDGIEIVEDPVLKRLLLKADRNVVAYRGDLNDTTDPTKGGNIPQFNPALAYVPAGLAWALKQVDISAMWFNDVRTAVEASTDCTAGVAAAFALMLSTGRKRLFFPAHPNGYVFNGGTVAGDGYKNGLLCPFTAINFDVASTIVLHGEGGTVFKCGSNDMVLLRISRNNVTVRDITLHFNGKTNVILCGVVPENMNQTTTQVSQSQVHLDGVNCEGGPGVEGIIFQPGPTVGGSDSGCFYHRVTGGVSNFVGGGRHMWFRKNADWATNPNRVTRTTVLGRAFLRGNTGVHIEVGSEISLVECHEELINSGTAPNATPVARYISDDCSNIKFSGGYSEACTTSVWLKKKGILWSHDYFPASGSDADWLLYAHSDGDGLSENRDFTPVVSSSGGGSASGSSTGHASKRARDVFFHMQISVPKTGLSAGTISIAGLPFIADPTWGTQVVDVKTWDNITLGANYTKLVGVLSGASLAIQKQHAQGAARAGLTVAECADPIVMTISGTYRA